MSDEVRFDTLFRFHGSNEELFPFLYEMEKKGKTVIFQNENIVLKPKEEGIEKNMKITIYNLLYSNPSLVDTVRKGIKLVSEKN